MAAIAIAEGSYAHYGYAAYPLGHLGYGHVAAHAPYTYSHIDGHYAGHYAHPVVVDHAQHYGYAPAAVAVDAHHGYAPVVAVDAHHHGHSATYTAANRGSVHTAPLVGHVVSQKSINTAPAPGTNY